MVTLRFDGKWADKLLARWIEESFRLLAPKSAVVQLGGDAPAKKVAKPTKKPARNKRTR
jgi:hypothetical protein